MSAKSSNVLQFPPIDLSDAPTQDEVMARSDPDPVPDLPADPVDDFRRAMAAHGIETADPILADGQLHRFHVQGDRPGSKNGWLVLHPDSPAAGRFGSWKLDIDIAWCSRDHRELTAEERARLDARMEATRRKTAEEKAKRHRAAREEADRLFPTLAPAPSSHGYLVRKQIQPHGALVDGRGNLAVPVYDIRGDVHGLEFISPTGAKWVLPGTDRAGHFFVFGDPRGAGELYIAEGFATSASVFEATKKPVICSFSANNLEPVARAWRDRLPEAKITIAGDDDQWRPELGNPGRTKAEEAARAIGAAAVFPTFKDLSDQPTDFSDLHRAEGMETVRQQIEGAAMPKSPLGDPVDIGIFLGTPPPEIPFFVRDRIPAGRGALLTGLGGSSKTRMLYHLALGAIVGRLPFEWEIERTGKAVLILTEDVADDVHRVLFHVARNLELTPEEELRVAEGLIVYPLAGLDIKLLTKTATGVVEKAPLFFELAERVKGYGDVVFIGIDPAIGITEGDELDQNHQRTLGKAVDDLAILTGATIMLASHSTKASLGQGELLSHASRGGGAITDAVRAEYAMRNMTAQEAAKAGIEDLEERKRHVQLVATKGNHLPPSAYVPLWMRRDGSGCLIGTDVCLDDEKGTLKGTDHKILDVFDDLSNAGVLNIAEWRAKCVELGLIKGKTEEAQTKAMKRVRRKLEAAGLIQRGVGRGVYTRNETWG